MERKYGALLQRISYGILRSKQDAEEVVNDCYMAVWDAIPPERPRYLSAYAARIVRNRALMRLEHRQRIKRDGRQDVLLSELEECLPSPSDPEAELEAAETLEIINRWLDTLPSRDRSIFVRRYFSMDDTEHIAADFGLTANAVAVRLHRLRAALKNHLIKEDVTL